MTNFLFSIIRSGAGILISRIFGLIRDMAIAAVYGATGLTDIFFVAFAIPNLFRQFFVEGAMSSAFMPFLAEKFKTGGKSAQNAYLTQLICLQSAMVTFVCAIIMIGAPIVIKLFIPGYVDDQALISQGVSILRIVMPFLLIISLCGMFAGFLNIHGSYFISYASSAMFNIMMIIGAWFGYKHSGDIMYLAYGTIAGGLAQLIIVYFFSLIYGFRPIFITKIEDSVKRTYLLLIPSLAGVGISQLNFLIGRILASFLQFGSISWLFYANRLFQFPLGVFSVAVGVVSLTELSKANADKDMERRNKMINKSLLSLMVIILPATIGLIGLASEITSLIYERKAFDALDVSNTAIALQMYSVGLMFFSLVNVLTRVFHAGKDTKTPVKCAFISFIVNIIFNLILMKPLGHAGIALASSIAALVNAFMLYRFIPEYKFSFRANNILLLKILFANIIMFGFLWVCKEYNIHVLINIGICCLVYGLTLFIMRVNILRILR